MKLFGKITEIREKATGALEDVPDTLIGTILFVTVLTLIALGILIVLGYRITNP